MDAPRTAAASAAKRWLTCTTCWHTWDSAHTDCPRDPGHGPGEQLGPRKRYNFRFHPDEKDVLDRRVDEQTSLTLLQALRGVVRGDIELVRKK